MAPAAAMAISDCSDAELVFSKLEVLFSLGAITSSCGCETKLAIKDYLIIVIITPTIL